MKKLFAPLLATAALLAGSIGTAHASFQTIDRTITNYTALNGSIVPATTVFASATFDLNNNFNLVAFSVTPVSTLNYSIANVASSIIFDANTGHPMQLIGGILNGLAAPTLNTDDFIASIDLLTGDFSTSYTVAGINDIFTSTTSTFSSNISDNFGTTVPEPGTLALGLLGGLAALSVRRNTRQH